MPNTPHISPKSTAEVRVMNRNRVYRYLYADRGGVTKQELAYALSMSLPTLTQNLNELLARGLIDNSGIADSSCGRKPRIISVVPDAHCAIGVEISSKHIRMVAIDLRVCVLAAETISRPFSPDDGYSAELSDRVEQFIAKNGLDPARILGIGFTVPGIVDKNQQTIFDAPTLNIGRLDTQVLTGRIQYPVNLTNDANAGGFAEWWDRTGSGDMAYLSLGRGVGGAILIAGVPYLGRSSRSGEFGHMCIHPDGKKCSCGRWGCLEAYCSTAVLSDDLGITLEQFFEELERGNREYDEIWNAYLNDLVIGIRNINAALDCGIVLGGKLSPFLAGHMAAVERRLGEADPDYQKAPYLSICRYDAHASGIGAALYFIDRFIDQI